MELGHAISPAPPPPDVLAISPVLRVKFDRWLFDRDIGNVEAGRLFGAHPLTIGRWRKRFDDGDRRVPPRRKIAEIAARTGGEITILDWHRSCVPMYPEEGAAVSVAAA